MESLPLIARFLFNNLLIKMNGYFVCSSSTWVLCWFYQMRIWCKNKTMRKKNRCRHVITFHHLHSSLCTQLYTINLFRHSLLAWFLSIHASVKANSIRMCSQPITTHFSITKRIIKPNDPIYVVFKQNFVCECNERL